MSEIPLTIRPLQREDREWVAHFLDAHWGSTQMITRGRMHYGHLLPGFVAERPRSLSANADPARKDDDATEENPIVQMDKVGLLTYNIEGDQCEVVSLDSIVKSSGVGTALVAQLVQVARPAGIKRIWLITTNDNLEALRFWQKRHFSLVTIHRNAIEQARRLKPQIPITGHYGIPIRDEIELELLF